MKLAIEIDGKSRSVELLRDSSRLRISLDGRPVDADAVEISPGVFSILLEGRSIEARVEPSPSGLRVIVAGREFSAAVRDPRQWRRNHGASLHAAGRAQILAPMPGKIIRVLVSPGAAITAGQGILVVEAMKMQNEVRSPKSGTLDRVLVSEGQTVNAGEVLAVVT
jgi:biotin carboxyl carrier protein